MNGLRNSEVDVVSAYMEQIEDTTLALAKDTGKKHTCQPPRMQSLSWPAILSITYIERNGLIEHERFLYAGQWFGRHPQPVGGAVRNVPSPRALNG